MVNPMGDPSNKDELDRVRESLEKLAAKYKDHQFTPESGVRLQETKGWGDGKDPSSVINAFMKALFDLAELKAYILRGERDIQTTMMNVHEILNALSNDANDEMRAMITTNIDKETARRNYGIGKYGIDYGIMLAEED
jgi:hypothetical protein